MNKLQIILASAGFIFTGFVLSTFAPHIMTDIRTLTNEVFATNCQLILSTPEHITILPQTCKMIQQFFPSLLIANGLLLLIFSLTRWTSFISFLSLLLLTLFYCNPLIDPSFTNYSHFLALAVCIAGFLVQFLSENETKEHSR